ncbi:MAG: hypothetical protein UHO61_01930 [Acutalibacteraceae bacterium]|nr:hypothetical protein [Acutalibacteraceae bacterium]
MKTTLRIINDLALNNPKGLVELAEQNYQSELDEVASKIVDNDDIKIVALAGPSASGKTTTAHILCEKLKALGEKTEIISLDDFYLPVDKLPVLEDGTRDIESVNALDIPLINKCFGEIIETGKTLLPKFNFSEKKRVLAARSIDVSGRSIAIVEGLHALNPLITDLVPQKNIFKAYISVNCGIESEDGAKLLSSKKIRLVRRVLRDRTFRGTPVNETLLLWQGVVEGEEKYLYCFKDTADAQIKTLHIYEPCLYRNEFLKLTDEVKENAPFRDYFLKIAKALERFVPIDISLLPSDSLITEFVGNGKYKL